MGRLTTLKPKLTTLGSRIARPEGEAARLAERDRTVGWRKWYHTARWQKLRRAVWVRDGFICQMTGVLCAGKYPAGNSPVADHRIRHQGDEALFWDMDNIHTVSKAYHDSQKQKEERRVVGL